ncbi:urease accessory protein [Pseudarcicella hirudinis]|uniref:Urease accessory protein UreE n=1 Tax=Pseudarcicella hirudinis TaxID=1079859 RepID=A0A1I5S369_9BACT|nr:urease accessory protein UreE [Pseudarcicella hirudinis]SFP65149.1 urease accessory protein [Pseudarcicella hirudinis]
MLIQQKAGNIRDSDLRKAIDWLQLEWYETNKRILRKKTRNGREISLKFLRENPELTFGDILFEDENTIIAVEVLPCECLVIEVKNMFETASVCYEIGNKHLPLFFEDGKLLVPFEMPLFRLLSAQGYTVFKDDRKLLNALKTTVSPHGNNESASLFSRIMQLTSSNE